MFVPFWVFCAAQCCARSQVYLTSSCVQKAISSVRRYGNCLFFCDELLHSFCFNQKSQSETFKITFWTDLCYKKSMQTYSFEALLIIYLRLSPSPNGLFFMNYTYVTKKKKKKAIGIEMK